MNFDFSDEERGLQEELRQFLTDRAPVARSRSALESAERLFHAHGSPGWTALARSELGSISGRRSSGEDLTPAERRIADLVAAGLRNREVAQRLVVAERTVEATLTRIYTKLGIRSRTELVARLRELSIRADIVELPRVGHYPQIEAPDAVLTAVRRALATMPA